MVEKKLSMVIPTDNPRHKSQFLYPSIEKKVAEQPVEVIHETLNIPNWEKSIGFLAMKNYTEGMAVNVYGDIYRIKGNQSTKLPKIVNDCKINDIIYYEPTDSFFVSEINQGLLIQIPGDENKEPLIVKTKIKYSILMASSIESEPFGSMLAVNQFERITVFSKAKQNDFKNGVIEISAKSSDAYPIYNFKLISRDRLVILQSNGMLILYNINQNKVICEIQLELGDRKPFHFARHLIINKQQNRLFVYSYCCENMKKEYFRDHLYAIKLSDDSFELLAKLDVFTENAYENWVCFIVSQETPKQLPVLICISQEQHNCYVLKKCKLNSSFKISRIVKAVVNWPSSQVFKIQSGGDFHWILDKNGCIYKLKVDRNGLKGIDNRKSESNIV